MDRTSLHEVCIEVNETDEEGFVNVKGERMQRPFMKGKPCIPKEFKIENNYQEGLAYRLDEGKVIIAGLLTVESVMNRRKYGDLFMFVRNPMKNERIMIRDYFMCEKGLQNVSFLLD